MKIFLSYSTADAEVAIRLRAALSARRPDYDIYIAALDMMAGQDWPDILATEIRTREAFIILMGETLGRWQLQELRLAYDLRTADPQRKFIPISLSGSTPSIDFVSNLHALSLSRQSLFLINGIVAILRALDLDTKTGRSEPWKYTNPYRGLNAFDEADSAYFFGRERLTAQIVSELADKPTRIHIAIGPSGVGKSSLIRAGVIASLHNEAFPLEEGASGMPWPQTLKGSGKWGVMTFSPKDDPLHQMMNIFIGSLLSLASVDVLGEVNQWKTKFREGASFSQFYDAIHVADIKGKRPGLPSGWIVYVDQAEEMYNVPSSDSGRQEDLTTFLRLLSELARHDSFVVLASLRTEFYHQWFVSRPKDLFCGHEIDQLTESDLIRAITKPAKELQVSFDPIEGAKNIAKAHLEQPGLLPLLSYSLEDMWQKMQERSSPQLKWSDGPDLTNFAAPLIKRMEAFRLENSNLQGAIKELFLRRLCRVIVNEGRIGLLRRRAWKKDCSTEVWQVVEKLSSSNLRVISVGADLSSGHSREQATYAEIGHEQALHAWEWLRALAQEHTLFLTFRDKLWEHIEAAKRGEGPEDLPEIQLKTAQNLLAMYESEFSQEELNFIKKSIKAANDREREEKKRQDRQLKDAIERKELAESNQRLLRGGLLGAVIISLALMGIVSWALSEKYTAISERSNALLEKSRAERVANVAQGAASSLVQRIIQGFRDTPGVPRDISKQVLATADEILSQLNIQPRTSNAVAQSVIIAELAYVYYQMGDTQQAQLVADMAWRGLSAFDKLELHEDSDRIAVSQASERLIEIYSASSNYQVVREVIAWGSKQFPAPSQSSDTLGIRLSADWINQIGRMAATEGDNNLAEGRLREAEALLAKAASENKVAFRVDISLGQTANYIALGDIEFARGNMKNAIEFYEKGWNLLVSTEGLAVAPQQTEPRLVPLLVRVGYTLNRLGRTNPTDPGDLIGAIQAFPRFSIPALLLARQTAEKVLQTDPKNVLIQDLVGLALIGLGDAAMIEGQSEPTRFYNMAAQVYLPLAANYLGNEHYALMFEAACRRFMRDDLEAQCNRGRPKLLRPTNKQSVWLKKALEWQPSEPVTRPGTVVYGAEIRAPNGKEAPAKRSPDRNPHLRGEPTWKTEITK